MCKCILVEGKIIGVFFQTNDDIYLGEDENAEFMKLQWILGELSETVIGVRCILIIPQNIGGISNAILFFINIYNAENMV